MRTGRQVRQRGFKPLVVTSLLLLAGVAEVSPARAAPVDQTAIASTPDAAELGRGVDDLRTQVEGVARELGELTAKWEQGRTRLDELRQLELAAGVDARETQQQIGQAQDRLDTLARTAYMHRTDPVLTAVLRGDLQAVASYKYLQRGLDVEGADRTSSVRELTVGRASAAATVDRLRDSRTEAQQLQDDLDVQLVNLRELAVRSERQLQAAAAAFARSVAQARQAERSRLAEGSGLNDQASGCSAKPGRGSVPNGFLRPQDLCALSVAGHRLAADAARGFLALDGAYRQAFGRAMCVTDSYRDYPSQVDVFRRKPSLAATPGRSRHGFGEAVDLCGGVESFESDRHRWMQHNATRYGFAHPAWARANGSRPEPWHWEFQP